MKAEDKLVAFEKYLEGYFDVCKRSYEMATEKCNKENTLENQVRVREELISKITSKGALLVWQCMRVNE